MRLNPGNGMKVLVTGQAVLGRSKVADQALNLMNLEPMRRESFMQGKGLATISTNKRPGSTRHRRLRCHGPDRSGVSERAFAGSCAPQTTPLHIVLNTDITGTLENMHPPPGSLSNSLKEAAQRAGCLENSRGSRNISSR